MGQPPATERGTGAPLLAGQASGELLVAGWGKKGGVGVGWGIALHTIARQVGFPIVATSLSCSCSFLTPLTNCFVHLHTPSGQAWGRVQGGRPQTPPCPQQPPRVAQRRQCLAELEVGCVDINCMLLAPKLPFRAPCLLVMHTRHAQVCKCRCLPSPTPCFFPTCAHTQAAQRRPPSLGACSLTWRPAPR